MCKLYLKLQRHEILATSIDGMG